MTAHECMEQSLSLGRSSHYQVSGSHRTGPLESVSARDCQENCTIISLARINVALASQSQLSVNKLYAIAIITPKNVYFHFTLFIALAQQQDNKKYIHIIPQCSLLTLTLKKLEISQWNSDNDIPTLLSCFTDSRTLREMTQSLASKQSIIYVYLDVKISEDSQKFFRTLRKLKPSFAASSHEYEY